MMEANGLLSLSSLQDRSARAALMREFSARASLPAPIPAEQIRELVNLSTLLYRLVRADAGWFFSRRGQADHSDFGAEIQALHGAASKALDNLVTRSGEWSRSDNDPLLQRLIGFALYHQGAAMKWCFFRHEPLPNSAWPPMHALYRFAEQAGFATFPMRLFDDESGHRTCLQALYLRSLLLDVLNTGGLSNAQVELADGWLADWASDYALDSSYLAATHALFVDLDAASGLQIATGIADLPSFRYLRVDRLPEQLEEARVALRAGRATSARAATSEFPVEEQVGLLNLIERLYQNLLQASATKIEQRTEVANLLAEVRLGFASARIAVAGNEQGGPGTADQTPMKFGGVELTLAPAAATPGKENEGAAEAHWKVRDMSSKGFGLLIGSEKAERIGTGELIAVKPDGFAHWTMGVVVRKITQRESGETLLGVEILCVRPLAVLLSRYSRTDDAEPDPALAPIGALYLPGRDADGTSDILLLPAGDFALKTSFSLATRAARFRVRINRVLRKGGNWIGLRFEVIGRKDWPSADSRTHR
jgi:hypothetical protein